MEVVDLLGVEDECGIDFVDFVDDPEELVGVDGLLLVLHPPDEEVRFEQIAEVGVGCVEVLDLVGDCLDLGLRQLSSLIQQDKHHNKPYPFVGGLHGHIKQPIIDHLISIDSDAFVLA